MPACAAAANAVIGSLVRMRILNLMLRSVVFIFSDHVSVYYGSITEYTGFELSSDIELHFHTDHT
jgi:hypothetical protein